jgi:hypothetical protein
MNNTTVPGFNQQNIDLLSKNLKIKTYKTITSPIV